MQTLKPNEAYFGVENLSREMVPDILDAVGDPCIDQPTKAMDAAAGNWNVVAALELLLAAGQIRAALSLASAVAELVGTDGRERLFRSYIAFTRGVLGGDLQVALEEVRSLYALISQGAHSPADKVNAGIILARTVTLGVSGRALSEDHVAVARSVLNQEIGRALSQADPGLACQAGIELIRSYLECSPQDVVTIEALIERFRGLVKECSVELNLAFDLDRLNFMVAADSLSHQVAEARAEELRAQAVPLGEVTKALADLSIARCSNISEAARAAAGARAFEIFKANRYLSGMFEIAHIQALSALEYGRADDALALFSQAACSADAGGFVAGSALAEVGAVQAALADGGSELDFHMNKLVNLMRCDLALGPAGLGTVAALQVSGRVKAAIRLASQCEKFFASRRIKTFHSQALFMLGSAHALNGKWRSATRAWKKGVAVDEERGAVLAAAEKRAALAQAMAMEEFSQGAGISAPVMARIERLLTDAASTTSRNGETIEAVRARAKILQTHAQLCMIARTPVDAVKHLSSARELFSRAECVRDVALSDALIGLALLEVAKSKGGALYEEAAASLQRALEFFANSKHANMRWKLKYYLSIAALMSSQSKGEGGERGRWLELASNWLQGAIKDVSLAEAQGADSGVDADFSPSLQPQALEALKQAIGDGPPLARRSSRRSVPVSRRRSARQLH